MRKVKSIFTKDVISCRPSDSIEEAANLMDDRNVGAIVVTEEDRPLGILTDRDIAMALAVRGQSKCQSVQDIMTCPVKTMSDEDGVYRATRYMMDNGLRRVPVINQKSGRLVGLVTLDDLLILLSRELDNLARGVQLETAAAT
jgi:signal-transduction protein with cAMP-binding, CBS, and nucleotidyltransferase domain